MLLPLHKNDCSHSLCCPDLRATEHACKIKSLTKPSFKSNAHHSHMNKLIFAQVMSHEFQFHGTQPDTTFYVICPGTTFETQGDRDDAIGDDCQCSTIKVQRSTDGVPFDAFNGSDSHTAPILEGQ